MTVTSSRAASPRDAIADAVRSRAAGGPAVGVEVLRRAVRGDDELLLLRGVAGSWWVTRRVTDVARVCAYIGDREAERDFEFFLSSPSPRGRWAEIPASAAA